jgi:ubiquitin-conjugating enzyme E2 O
MEGSQMDATNDSPPAAPEADAPMPQALGEVDTLKSPTADLLEEKRLDVGDESTEEATTAGGMVTEEDASTGPSADGDARGDISTGTIASTGFGGTPVSRTSTRTPLGQATEAGPADMDVDDNDRKGGSMTLEDMAWEPLPTDHQFMHCVTSASVPSDRMFMRRVQREWTILARGLPRNVWVHVYPDRMELLRACLVGPEGTPYSDALFFFDLHLPPTYPQIPPQVRFWSFGENLNPNLYENGKVCLSLLGTWSGKDSETWSPERSNLLQVLVSILGLVLNTEPYYNEPGFERERDTPQGDLRSQRYNESVALSNYHLMLRVLRTPPTDFDRMVKLHFAERRRAILDHCQWLQCSASSQCSEGFRKSLAALVPRLTEALPLEPPPDVPSTSDSAPMVSADAQAIAAMVDAGATSPMEEAQL